MDTKAIGHGNQVRDVALTPSKSSAADNVDALKTNTRGPQNASADSVNVSLSSEAKDLAEAKNKALNIAMNAPDIREDRVAELKRKISSGEYQIDSEKIADGMLREALREKLAALPE